MTYVMSDLHGMAGAYETMLKRIGFKEEDVLYILGDLCDRGSEAARILQDVRRRKNVFCLKGNHEQMLEMALPSYFPFLRKITGEWSREEIRSVLLWEQNGGEETVNSLQGLPEQEVEAIYRFVMELPSYFVIERGGKRYTMVHGGVPEGVTELSRCPEWGFLWERPDFHGVFGDGEKEVLIVGHTPTFLLDEKGAGRIFHGEGNVVDVDCGCVFRSRGGKLGCLCLESGEEFYC